MLVTFLRFILLRHNIYDPVQSHFPRFSSATFRVRMRGYGKYGLVRFMLGCYILFCMCRGCATVIIDMLMHAQFLGPKYWGARPQLWGGDGPCAAPLPLTANSLWSTDHFPACARRMGKTSVIIFFLHAYVVGEGERV